MKPNRIELEDELLALAMLLLLFMVPFGLGVAFGLMLA
jgi:hypothetical protein